MTDDEIIKAAQKLIDAVTYDVSGVDGKGGNGGLVSTATIRACDECRLAISRYKARKAAPDV